MIDLTVGQVAGIINVAVVFAQLTLPLAVVFVLVGVLHNSHNAATWSVVGRLLNGTLWPSIMSTDTAASKAVSKRVITLSWLSTLSLIFLGIVSIITPLGLGDSLDGRGTEIVDFFYTRDPSPVGRGTLPRDGYVQSRACGVNTANCPGNYHGFTFFSNETDSYVRNDTADAWVSTANPSNVTNVFGRDLNGDRRTVAGPLDIQYRSFFIAADEQTSQLYTGPRYNVDQGRPRVRGQFQALDSFVLKEQYDVVEGLVVDSISGGVGFRNHTIPVSTGLGMQWTESILWIEPESVCLDTNLTIEYTVSGLVDDDIVTLVDRGGFSQLTRDYPYIDLNDTQNRPELLARAWKGASLNNMNIMIHFNETRNNTRLGKTYRLENKLKSAIRRLEIGVFPGSSPFIPGFPFQDITTNYSASQEKYIDTSIATRGFGGNDEANINTIAVETGMMLGAASPMGDHLRPDPGTNWTFPMYCCATALKASIKDVTFRINGSALLSSLNVVSIEPQTYASNAEAPLWAVENSAMNISEVSPFWGVVADEQESNQDLFTRRSPSIYLPAGQGSESTLYSTSDSAAGAEGPEAVLTAVYSSAASRVSGDTVYGTPDYSGFSNYPTLLKWQELSKSAATAPKILNLIWTDLAANYIMGSTIGASTLQGSVAAAAALESPRRIQVQTFSHRITYDLRYAIPALIFLFVYVAVVFVATLMWIIRRARFSYLRALLNQTATGRAATTERHGEEVRTLSTGKWIKALGGEEIGIRKDLTGRTMAGKEVFASDEGTAGSPLMKGNKGEIAPHVREIRRSP